MVTPWFKKEKKSTTVDNGYTCERKGAIGNFEPSWFCCKPKTALTKSLKKLKFRVDVFGKTFVSLSYMYIYDMCVCVYVLDCDLYFLDKKFYSPL